MQATRTKVSTHQINTAIEQLNEQGTKPTIRAVREHLGNTGSPNRIQPLLAAWHENNRPAEVAKAVLSEHAQQTLADLLARERNAAVTDQLEAISELNTQLEAVTLAGRQLEDENERLASENIQVHEQQRMAETLLVTHKQRVEQLETEQNRLQAQAHDLAQQLATAQAQLAMQQQQNQQQQAQIEQQAMAIAEKNQQVAQANQLAAVSDAKQQAATEAALAANKHIEKLEANIDKQQTQTNAKIDALQQRLDDAYQQRTTDAQTHAKQLAQRDKQLQLEHQKNTQLEKQRDELRKELQAANALTTMKPLKKNDKGEDLHAAKDTADLFDKTTQLL